MAIDTTDFRRTLGCFATGITVITTVDDDGAPVGLTANSFTSLSLDPPMVLFCLDRKVQSFQAFHEKRHFAVNILHESQREISTRFAMSGVEKWSGIEFETWDTGCPILRGCLANLECDIDSIYEGGDHVIVVGRVRRLARADEDDRPLIYYRGGYTALNGG
jgi:flavin reductase (DIM6/NTAB) family NADH-FMN oxidoreductase RutF